MVIISTLFIIFALLPVIWWFRYGRDDKIVETVEFYPPENMTPAEVAFAIDGELDDEEMMYMIFYLADKGYLSMEKGEKQFILHYEKPVAKEEPDYVKTFAEWLFPGKETVFRTSRSPLTDRKLFDVARDQVQNAYNEKYGQVHSLKSENKRWMCSALMGVEMWIICLLCDGFRESYMALGIMAPLELALFEAWTGFDNFRLNKKKGIARIVGGIAVTLLLIVIWAWMEDYLEKGIHFLVYLISQTILMFFSLIMQKRSKESTELMGRLYGFRRFIKEAEYVRIQTLMKEDPGYFFHILPYAAVLGLETNWTKHFAGLATGNPSWCHMEDDEEKRDEKWYGHMMTTCAKSLLPSKAED